MHLIFVHLALIFTLNFRTIYCAILSDAETDVRESLMSPELRAAHSSSAQQSPPPQQSPPKGEAVAGSSQSPPLGYSPKRRSLASQFLGCLGTPVRRSKDHATVKQSLERRASKLGEQLMFAGDIEQLIHLKEVLKTVLYFQQILQILKRTKDESEYEMETNRLNIHNAVEVAMLEEQLAVNRKQLEHIEKAQKAVKTDLDQIDKALGKGNWLFLSYIKKRNSNLAAYNNAVNDWMTQRLEDPTPEELDKWESQNRDKANKLRAAWKKMAAFKAGQSIQNAMEIAENPGAAGFRTELKCSTVVRVDVVMERDAREKFVAVASDAMRNYAAVSEPMDRTEIGRYENIFKQFHPAIGIVFNANKEFNADFDRMPQRPNMVALQPMENEQQKKIGKSPEKSGFLATLYMVFMPYDKRSEAIHFEQLEKAIREFSERALMAPNREERNRAMEVLEIAVFLREFHKAILSQNPDESQKQKAQAASDAIKEEIARMDAECARWQAEVDNLRGELARAEATYNDTNARAQYAHAVMQERNAQEEADAELAELAQAQMAADAEASPEPPSPRGSVASGSGTGGSRRFGGFGRRAAAGNNVWRRRKRAGPSVEDAQQALEEAQRAYDDAASELNDKKSLHDERRKALERAQQMIQAVELNYQEGRNKAKRARKYLDDARTDPSITLDSVLMELEQKCAERGATDQEEGRRHFFRAAFENWRQETLAIWEAERPRLVIYGGGETLNASQDARMDRERLQAVVQLLARAEFQKDADRFLVNYSWLASQMSAEEVEACAAQLRLFRAIDVSIVPEYVELNGRWSYNREPPLRRAPATSWLCTAGARTRSSLGVSSRLGQNINAGGVARDPDAQQAGRTHNPAPDARFAPGPRGGHGAGYYLSYGDESSDISGTATESRQTSYRGYSSELGRSGYRTDLEEETIVRAMPNRAKIQEIRQAKESPRTTSLVKTRKGSRHLDKQVSFSDSNGKS